MKISTTVIIIALAILCFLSIRGCINTNKQLRTSEITYKALDDSARIWKDQVGRLHAENTYLEMSSREAVVYFGQQLDSMAVLLKVKPKQITSIVKVPFRTDINLDSLKEALARVDTVQIRVVDSVPGRVTFNGIMTLTKYHKPFGFLNLKDRQLIDVYFDNPAFSPLNVNGFDITDKPKRFGIGPYVGYGWDGIRWAPSAGVSVHYDLIRF